MRDRLTAGGVVVTLDGLLDLPAIVPVVAVELNIYIIYINILNT